ncbi:DUF4199 domain-containing protein [Candidatus Uhrbacteria bacterium]|nr:DUF4199 domain-containing protein [Candidatus Uhrbacteria bacterium]
MIKGLFKTWNTELRYGLIMVGATLLWMVGENIMVSVFNHPEWGEITGSFSIIIPVTAYWMLLTYLRKRDKALQWQTAIRSCAVMTLAFAVVGAIVTYFYILYIPQPIESYLTYLQSTLELKGQSAEQISSTVSEMRELFAPHFQATILFLSSFVTGAILTFGLTLIQRKKVTQKTSSEK